MKVDEDGKACATIGQAGMARRRRLGALLARPQVSRRPRSIRRGPPPIEDDRVLERIHDLPEAVMPRRCKLASGDQALEGPLDERLDIDVSLFAASASAAMNTADRIYSTNSMCHHCDHSSAVVPSHDGLCGVPVPFLSVTSLGRGFRFRYQIRVLPAAVDLGAVISAECRSPTAARSRSGCRG